MEIKFKIDSESLFKIIYKYTNRYPKRTIASLINSQDIKHYLSNYYYFDKKDVLKLIAKLIEDKIIVVNKYKYNGYDKKMLFFDFHRVYELFNIIIGREGCISVKTSLMSESLLDELFSIKDSRLDDSHFRSALEILTYKNVSNKNDRHFTINNKGEMRYTPKGRLTVLNESEKWVNDNRYRSNIKIGKGLKKIFSNQVLPISNQEIEIMSNILKSRYVFNGSIKIVSGEDIRGWYHGDMYANSNTDSLGNSCMRHNSCQTYFDIYTENPDKVRMIIALDEDGYLLGRALLWKTDNIGLFCDRIYGSDITIEAIKNYAKELGAYVKYKQSYSDARLVSNIGEIYDDVIEVTLKGEYDEFPYMDTLKYTDELYSGVIHLNSESGDICLEETDGGPNESMVTVYDGSRVHEDDARWVERYEEYYHIDDVIHSDFRGEYVLREESICINDGNDYTWEDDDDFVYLEHTGEYFHIDDVVWSDYDGIYVEEAEECVIHGYIDKQNTQTLYVNDEEFICHIDVTKEDLIEAGIIENTVENED